MDGKFLIFCAIAVTVILSIYSSSSILTIFVEGYKGVPASEISCYAQNGKTRCCGSEMEIDPVDGLGMYYTGKTYCTTCDNTQPPSNCSPRETIESAGKEPGTDVLNALTGLDVKPDSPKPKFPGKTPGLDPQLLAPTNDTNNDTDVKKDLGRLNDGGPSINPGE